MAEPIARSEAEREAVLAEFRAAGALLEGHFILSSGRHSPVYLQCARVLMDPKRAERLVAMLVPALRDFGAEMTVAPALGGIVFGYEVARQLEILSVFVERVEGRFVLRRGFEIPPGTPVLVTEDVVTTGLSTRECIEAVEAAGGRVVAATCLVDRSGGRADVGVPLVPLIRLDLPTYAPDEVPPELAAIPAEKPGSRGLRAR